MDIVAIFKSLPKLASRLHGVLSAPTVLSGAPLPPFENSWREELIQRAPDLAEVEHRRLLASALLYDFPAWLLLRRLPLGRSHLLTIGGAWGRQVELLVPHYDQITLVEPDHDRRTFLRHRFYDHPDKPHLLKSLEGVSTPVDLIHIRQTSLDTFPDDVLIHSLRELRLLSPDADLFVETTTYADLWKWYRVLRKWPDLHFELYIVDGGHSMATCCRQIIEIDRAFFPTLRLQRNNPSFSVRDLFPTEILLIARSTPRAKSDLRSFRIASRGFAMPLPLSQDPICRIPLGPRAVFRCSRAHEMLTQLHNDEAVPLTVRAKLPQSQQNQTREGLLVFYETLMPGRPGKWNLDEVRTRRGIRWLASLHQHTYQIVHNPNSPRGRTISQRIDLLVTLGDKIVKTLGDSGHQTDWRTIRPALRHIPWSHGLSLAGTHGDFHAGNLLFRADELSGVIDWETAYPAAIPVRDLFWILISREITDHLAAANTYQALFLREEPPEMVSFYQDLVDPALATFVWHPWCRIAYPLERIQSAWDGYDLKGVVVPKSFASNFLDLLSPLVRFIEKTPCLKKTVS